MGSQDDAFRLTRDALKSKKKYFIKQRRENRTNKTDAITKEEFNEEFRTEKKNFLAMKLLSPS